MPNLSHGNFCHKLGEFVDIPEKNGLFLFIFDTVINHNSGLMHVKYSLALCQNRMLMTILSKLLCRFEIIAHMNS